MIDPAAPVALLLAAVAVELLPGRGPVRQSPRPGAAINPSVRRTLLPATGAAAALFLIGAPWWLTASAALAAGWVRTGLAHRQRPLSVGEMRSLAATLDLLAACLDAGLATTAALFACLGGPTAPAGRGHEALAQVSALLLVGGQPEDAWRPAASIPALAGLASAAGRSAVGGLTLADAARETAASLRGACRTAVSDRAARAGVAMTAPLAVCFLPAFLCLGLAPTIIGMVTSIHLW
jgi:hypothetical protein